jgi:Thrombospondin type 1 domain
MRASRFVLACVACVVVQAILATATNNDVDEWKNACWSVENDAGPSTRSFAGPMLHVADTASYHVATCGKEFALDAQTTKLGAGVVVSSVVARAFDDLFKVSTDGVFHKTSRTPWAQLRSGKTTHASGTVSVVASSKVVLTVPRVGRIILDMVDIGASGTRTAYYNLQLTEKYCAPSNRIPGALCDGTAAKFTGNLGDYAPATFVQGKVYNNTHANTTVDNGPGLANVVVNITDTVGWQVATTDGKGVFRVAVVGPKATINVSVNQSVLNGTRITRGSNPREIAAPFATTADAGQYGYTLISAIRQLGRVMPDDCVVSNFTEWGTCGHQTGIQVRTRTVVREAGANGRQCGALKESRKCSVNCTQTEFSSWSECSTEGGSFRTRTVTIAPLNGGKPCGPAIQARGCIYVNETAKHDDDAVVIDGEGLGQCGFSWFKFHPLADSIKAAQKVAYDKYLKKRETYRSKLLSYQAAMKNASALSSASKTWHSLADKVREAKWTEYKQAIAKFQASHDEHEKYYERQYRAFRKWRYLVKRYNYHKERHNKRIRDLVSMHRRWKKWPLSKKGKKSRK